MRSCVPVRTGSVHTQCSVLSTQYSVLSAPSRLLGYLLGLFLVPALAKGAEAPQFELHTRSGAIVTGPLQALDENWSVRLGGPKGARTDGGDVISLRRLGKPLPAPSMEEQLIFGNGDRVPGTVLKLAGERFHFLPDIGDRAETTVLLSAVSVIWLAAPDGTDNADALCRRLLTEPRARDLVLLRNGDVLEGIFLGLHREKAVQIEVVKKTVEVNYSKVAAIALTGVVPLAKPNRPYARVVLANGGRLSLASVRCTDGKVLEGKMDLGTDVRIPVRDLAALDLFQGAAVYLSDLKAARYEHTPYLGVRWPYRNDSSVAGRDLRLGGGVHDKGLGMHSESRLTYALGGGYQRFEALAGLDDQTGRGGSVRVKVLVDGKPQDLGWDKELTSRDKPLPIGVNVAGARELTLVVEFGQRGSVNDHVNWVDARLVK